MELFRNFGFSRVRVPRRGAFHSGLARALVKRGQRRERLPPGLARALVKRGQRRERNFRSSLAFSRAQARSAPRAHERELLCVSQSSKERLRRSRTESSGAAPAIEELPGAARQCKARRAACGGEIFPLGTWAGTSWDAISKQWREQKVKFPDGSILICDGEPGLSEAFAEYASEQQRCHWRNVSGWWTQGKRPASSMVMVDRGEIFSKGKMATK